MEIEDIMLREFLVLVERENSDEIIYSCLIKNKKKTTYYQIQFQVKD